SRGGVGATTAAVSCAWLMATEQRERVALVDLDLHFGTVALKLDLDPGSGLCEALEQPSRIDSLFIERAMVKVTDNLRVLAAEASATQHLDAGAVDMLLHELRRNSSGRGRSAAGRQSEAARRAGCRKPGRRLLRAQPGGSARHDPAADPGARAGSPGSALAGRGGRWQRARSDRQKRIRKGHRQIVRRQPFLRLQIGWRVDQFRLAPAG